MELIRFGIAGLGPRGRRGWIPLMRLVEGTQIVAVCDPVAGRRAGGAEAAGLAPADAYVDLDDLLARPDVDTVAVAVAPEHIVDVSVRCLEAGKPVICEVPLAYTLADCWRAVLAHERTGLTLAMAEQTCYSAFVLAWRDLVAAGKLGHVLYGEAQYIHGMTPNRFWDDARTGEWLTWEQARDNPNAVRSRNWALRHPIWYTPHSLAPLLRALDDHLDDRVVRVTGMATRPRSYFLEQSQGVDFPVPDFEVALMHTAGDAVLRLATAFNAPTPRSGHWYHLIGTGGEVETDRRHIPGSRDDEHGLSWLTDSGNPDRAEASWRFGPDQASPRAATSGHGGLDYFPLAEFVAHLRGGPPPTIDVYRAAELAAPAILAAISIEQGSIPLAVPDFRPGPHRPKGQPPITETRPAGYQ